MKKALIYTFAALSLTTPMIASAQSVWTDGLGSPVCYDPQGNAVDCVTGILVPSQSVWSD